MAVNCHHNYIEDQAGVYITRKGAVSARLGLTDDSRVAAELSCSTMPAPTNEGQRLEQELAELPEQIAAYQRELDATPIENRGRREMRAWQIRRAQKRLAGR